MWQQWWPVWHTVVNKVSSAVSSASFSFSSNQIHDRRSPAPASSSGFCRNLFPLRLFTSQFGLYHTWVYISKFKFLSDFWVYISVLRLHICFSQSRRFLPIASLYLTIQFFFLQIICLYLKMWTCFVSKCWLSPPELLVYNLKFWLFVLINVNLQYIIIHHNSHNCELSHN